MEVPVLPLEMVAIHPAHRLSDRSSSKQREIDSRERDSLGLDQVQRLESLARTKLLPAVYSLFGKKLGEVVEAFGGRRNPLATRLGEGILGDVVRDGRARESSVGPDAVGSKVDVENLAGVGVDDTVEVERVSVEVLIGCRSEGSANNPLPTKRITHDQGERT